MEKANEFNRQHLILVNRLLAVIDPWPAEIVSYAVEYELFGSWTIVIRRNGTRTKISFDGRDSYLEALRLPPDASDFSRPPKQISGCDFAVGLTDQSFDRILNFIRRATD